MTESVVPFLTALTRAVSRLLHGCQEASCAHRRTALSQGASTGALVLQRTSMLPYLPSANAALEPGMGLGAWAGAAIPWRASGQNGLSRVVACMCHLPCCPRKGWPCSPLDSPGQATPRCDPTGSTRGLSETRTPLPPESLRRPPPFGSAGVSVVLKQVGLTLVRRVLPDLTCPGAWHSSRGQLCLPEESPAQRCERMAFGFGEVFLFLALGIPCQVRTC